MAQAGSLSHEELTALCARAFPELDKPTVVEVQPLASRQHEMIAFEMWWMDTDGILRHQDLIVRRYVSTISWWRPDDRGKAQREATLCRWLHSQGFPVPNAFSREFSLIGDRVLFEKLPNRELSIGGRPLREVVVPYIDSFTRRLAELHRLAPPDHVKKVVPRVTLPAALANLSAIAFQIRMPQLSNMIAAVNERVYDVVETEPVLIHGDYHLLNVLIGDGEIGGIVDWEYSALGDPRWDIANAYMQLVDFGAAEAADQFLRAYHAYSGSMFVGPPLYNVVTPLQQWAVSEWLIQLQDQGRLPEFALAEDLVSLCNVHRRRAEMAMDWLSSS